jgi:hypothetical protein
VWEWILTVVMNRKRASGVHGRDEIRMQYFQNLIFCIVRADVTYKQVTEPIFNSQQYCYSCGHHP